METRTIAGQLPFVAVPIALACFLTIAFTIYWVGIQGGTFHFDDRPNLGVLGDFGGVDSFHDFIVYLKSGIAGPTGRPLALLSFLLDGQTWPTDPKPFLRTNALIHGVNGFFIFLIGWLLLKYSYRDRLPQHALTIAGLSAALWLVHPYWVSSVLYVVQRMATLSALFCLAGIALYLKGRALSVVESTRKTGWWVASIAVLLGTGLGVLAKENAALLPLLLLVVEFIGVRSLWAVGPSSRFERTWFIVFLIAPSVGLLAYLVRTIDFGTFFEVGAVRLFSPYQRLITEPGVLLGYLHDLLIPQPGYPGLYQENYLITQGLFASPSAIPSLLSILGIVFVGIWKRKQIPLIALALLFFFAGHLLESTVLMLELKFEHRNYLPAALLFLPLAAGIVLNLQRVRWVLAASLLILLGAFTVSHAALWGRPLELALYWAERNPDSYRAQFVAAGELDRSGRKQEALNLLQEASNRHPDSPALHLAYAGFLQSVGDTSAARIEADAAIKAITTGPFDSHINIILEPMLDAYSLGRSSSLPADIIENIITAFESRKEYNRSDSDRETYAYARARLKLSDGDISASCEHFLAMQRKSGRIGTDLLIFSLLASNGYYADARYFLVSAQQKIALGIDAGLRFAPDWYRSEINRLEQNVTEDERKVTHPLKATCDIVEKSEIHMRGTGS